MAADEASFNTSTDSISWGLILLRLKFSMGRPSTTYKGLVPAVMELMPRMRMMGDWPGAPWAWVILTPGNSPAKACVTLLKERSLNLSKPTEATEPVTALLLWVP